MLEWKNYITNGSWSQYNNMAMVATHLYKYFDLIVEAAYNAAHLDEIREKGFSFVPSRYIEFVDRDTEMDYQTALTQMSQQFDALKKRRDENEDKLVNAFKMLGYGK